jgi:hypothetical protein
MLFGVSTIADDEFVVGTPVESGCSSTTFIRSRGAIRLAALLWWRHVTRFFLFPFLDPGKGALQFF